MTLPPLYRPITVDTGIRAAANRTPAARWRCAKARAG